MPISTTTPEQGLTRKMDANPNPNPNPNTSIPNLVVDVILNTLQDMQQQIDCLQNNNQNYNDHVESQPPSHNPTHHSSYPNHVQLATSHHLSHPLTKFIISEPIPSSYRPLVYLKLYNRTTDPQRHIDAFKNAMLISGDSDAMRYKAFPTTLSEAAQQWFSSLPPRSVGDFFELTEKFLTHFTTNHSHQKIASNLCNLIVANEIATGQRKRENKNGVATKFYSIQEKRWKNLLFKEWSLKTRSEFGSRLYTGKGRNLILQHP